VSPPIGWISTTRNKWGRGAVPAPRSGLADGRIDYRPRMRHIATLIAAIVITPLAWILLALGQDRSTRVFADAHATGVYHRGDFVRPLLVLAAAGLLLGLIATLRVSPLGAVAAGAVYATSYIMLLVAPGRVQIFFGHDIHVGGHLADPMTPIRTGTTLVLGTLLLVGVASVRRWQRWPRPDQAFQVDPERDRPLGLDGLGLTPGRRGTEPEAVQYPYTPAHFSSYADTPAGGSPR
jgi:hypothetical protein